MKRRQFIKSATQSAAAFAGTSLLPSAAWSVGQDEYEFIIVGSGAGGGPLAFNLAKEGFSVLLIEAGKEKIPFSTQVPGFHGLASEEKDIAWNFWVKHYDDPEAHANWQADKGGVMYPRGSAVGGSTTMNALVCVYPDASDWKKLEKLTGDRSWDPDKMRDLFLTRVENSHYFKDFHKGWLPTDMAPISLLQKDNKLFDVVLGAVTEGNSIFDEVWHAGENYVWNAFNLESYLSINHSLHLDDEGFLRAPMNAYKGKRYGVHDLIQGARKVFKNLTVMPDTFVKKVIFDDSGDELIATGVEVLKGTSLYGAHAHSPSATVRETKVLKAQKEVILSGGAFNTPQLLMLSGIGPSDMYDSLTPGAPVKGKPHKVLEGVGRNLQDRYEVTVVNELDSDFDIIKNCTFQTDESKKSTDPCLEEWLDESTRKESAYGSNGVVSAVTMKSSDRQRNNDLFLFGIPGDFRGYFPDYSRKALKTKNKFSWAILKGHTQNRSGRVKLKDDNPLNTPDIHFNYFEGPGAEEDLQAMFEGVQKVRSITRNTWDTHKPVVDSPLAIGFDAKAASTESRAAKNEIFPGTEVDTVEGVKSWIKKQAWGHHASCSAKIGNHEKDGSVINGDFLVHGTKNLRIVDASVFPEIPGLFIVTPIYMVSEKASDVLIKKHKA